MIPVTRAQFLKAAGGCALLSLGDARAALARATKLTEAAAARSPAAMSFKSRPDLRPPAVNITAGAVPPGEGYLFLGPTGSSGAQPGPMIVDSSAQLVWFRPVPTGRWVTNFRIQQYAGQPVLTWWEGKVDTASGYGRGSAVLLDSSYGQIAQIRGGHGRQADLHELLLTPQGTALITCYPDTIQADLSSIGGAQQGQVLQSVIQEVDVRTGRLVFEWRSLDHVPVSESYFPVGGVYDYLHVNSIELTADGHLLVSARHTCALYKIHRRTGRVLWRLGGKRSDFAMGRGTRFAWQHDARVHPGGRISLFDDGAGPRRTESQSRGLVLGVDHGRRRVSLVQAYRHPQPLLAYAMGNMQVLTDGSVIVGWGNYPSLSEFAADGSLACDMRLPWGHETYRAYRLPWSALPAGQPALTAATSSGSSTLYASWNGATEVAAWQASAGPSSSQLTPVGITSRSGFETAIPLTVSSGYAAVTALDPNGQALASSPVVEL